MTRLGHVARLGRPDWVGPAGGPSSGDVVRGAGSSVHYDGGCSTSRGAAYATSRRESALTVRRAPGTVNLPSE